MITIHKEYTIHAEGPVCFDSKFCQHLRYHRPKTNNWLMKLFGHKTDRVEYWYCFLFGDQRLDISNGLRNCPRRCRGCLASEKKESHVE